MTTLWIVVNVLIYTFILNVLYRQTYNLIFILAKRPLTWVLVISIIGIINVIFAYMMSWNPRTVITVILLLSFLNFSPSPPKGVSKDKFKGMVNDVYLDWGIIKGSFKNKLGYFGFVISSLGSYVLLFGESCSADICKPIFERMLF